MVTGSLLYRSSGVDAVKESWTERGGSGGYRLAYAPSAFITIQTVRIRTCRSNQIE